VRKKSKLNINQEGLKYMDKILIIGGSLQSANMGINALTKGLLNGIYTSNDKVQVSILSFTTKEKTNLKFENNENSYVIEEIPSNVKENIKILLKHTFYRIINVTKQKRSCVNCSTLYSAYLEADMILDLSAGDSFTDIYRIKRYIYTSLPKLISIIMKKKLILMPQTIGPFNYKVTRLISKYIVNRCYMNYARDGVSYNYLLNKLNVAKTRVSLVPDLAFNMLPSKEELLGNIIEANNKNKAALIGINVSSLLFNGGYTSNNQFKLILNYKDLIDKIIKYFIDRNCNILLVPHVICPAEDVEDDYSLCKKMASKISKYYPNIYTFDKKYMEAQIKTLIGKCDFFIGSRMHACIGAISMGVPTVPVAYSRKFIGIWEQYGMKDCIADAKTMSIEEIISKIDYCYTNKSKVKDTLDTELKNVKDDIDAMFESIMNC